MSRLNRAEDSASYLGIHRQAYCRYGTGTVIRGNAVLENTAIHCVKNSSPISYRMGKEEDLDTQKPA